MTQRTRRRILAAAGALGVSATAGCLSGDESDSDDGADDGSSDTGQTDDGTDDATDPSNESGSTDESSSIEGTVLGNISVDNLHDAAHTVDVQVELNGSMESWVSKEIESRTGSVTLDRSWDGTGGEFRVRVRLDGTEFVEVTPADWNSPDCLSLIVVIDQSGALRIAGDTTGGFCAQ